MSHTVVLVGCGNMGRAMLAGWIEAASNVRILVVEPSDEMRQRAMDLGADAVAAFEELPADIDPDLIYIAVKPQVMADILPPYARWAGGRTTFVSVAAGTTITTLSRLLPGPTPIIRCMPNTPSAIGAGMLVCVANEHAQPEIRDLTTAMLRCSGEVDWIDDEALMDAVTAVSGSGPAYIFHMVECLAAAGERVGLPAGLAMRMAKQTVMGAGRLAAESDTPPGTLREQVTSPGGTTAAGLSVLMAERGLPDLMAETVEAARDRGRELGKG